MKYFPFVLAAALSFAIVWSGIDPASRGVWWMEISWVMGVFALLAATYRRFRFSNVAYGLVFIWLVMHTVGAHYTFEYVPFEWFNRFLGSERNHYDRVAHFCIGFNSFMLAELAYRKRWITNTVFSAVSGVFAIMAMAAAWEIIEWGVAVWDGGADGLAFLGAQGDIWDAQKDMLCDTLGALCSALLFVRLYAGDMKTGPSIDGMAAPCQAGMVLEGVPGEAAAWVGREFVHFKGGHYRLLAFSTDSETREPLVVYRALYGEGGLWVRPAKMFFESVMRDGKTFPRFRPV